MKKIWTDEAWEDYLSWHEKDKKTLKKYIRFFRILIEMVTTAQESVND